ncbi:MAG: 50S ribosomal protein L7ae [Ruminococcaceae bacterium]|nr:50S ribosomal protein L7ae [Oscillospiraceae bacterium]
MRNEGVEGSVALLRALGLCAKAGRLITGVPMICEALKTGKKLFLVIEPSDNAKNSSKRLHDRCAYYGVPLHTVSYDGETLSHAVGKSARIAALAVTDENLSRLVLSGLEAKTEK